VLQADEVVVAEERNARKEPLSEDEVRSLLGAVSAVWIARGRKIRELDPADCSPEDLKGPTGNFRAPIVRVGNRLLVGFHPDALRDLLGG